MNAPNLGSARSRSKPGRPVNETSNCFSSHARSITRRARMLSASNASLVQERVRVFRPLRLQQTQTGHGVRIRSEGIDLPCLLESAERLVGRSVNAVENTCPAARLHVAGVFLCRSIQQPARVRPPLLSERDSWPRRTKRPRTWGREERLAGVTRALGAIARLSLLKPSR
jgi:hypothetical protein